MPVGSQVIAQPANLKTLLGFSRSFKNDPEAANEALRCVANALLLVEQARVTWTDKEVGGGDACVDLLNVSIRSQWVHRRLINLMTTESNNGRSNILSLSYIVSLHSIIDNWSKFHTVTCRRQAIGVWNRSRHSCSKA